ncbi:MAG TPA: plasmid maintenance system killer family protein, partial [Oceanospirillales bacterium]|nr:plasmid maintenance system killer family protein [Oceanospirillales bacterium]
MRGRHQFKCHSDLKDFYSIRVNRQWRIVFKWVDGSAQDV